MRITPIDFSQNHLLVAIKNPMARVLEHARAVGNAEQTVSILAEATNLDLETVESTLKQLTRLGLAQPTRRLGNMQAYRFNVDNNLQLPVGAQGLLERGKRIHR